SRRSSGGTASAEADGAAVRVEVPYRRLVRALQGGKMASALISDKLAPIAAEVFSARGIHVDVRPGLTQEELIDVIGRYDGLAIRSATKVTAGVIAAAKRLKVIGRAGIGVDNVDVPAATAKGIVVMNTPFVKRQPSRLPTRGAERRW